MLKKVKTIIFLVPLTLAMSIAIIAQELTPKPAYRGNRLVAIANLHSGRDCAAQTFSGTIRRVGGDWPNFYLDVTLIVPAQDTVVPILYSETLLGGAQNGKWITAEKTDAQLKDKTEFRILSFNGFKKGSIFGTKEDDRGVCTETPMITFEEPDDYDTDSPPFAIGANAKWNPVPRLPQAIGLKDKTYTKIVADFLKTKGIAKTKIKITQAFRIDLEGDGKDEIIITGNYYKKGRGETQNAGDYSFILLRRTVKGKPQNVLIEGDFFTAKLLRSGEFFPPNIHEITAIADLNGDGKMEIVLADFGYEAHSYTILEMKNGKPVRVLESECSV